MHRDGQNKELEQNSREKDRNNDSRAQIESGEIDFKARKNKTFLAKVEQGSGKTAHVGGKALRRNKSQVQDPIRKEFWRLKDT